MLGHLVRRGVRRISSEKTSTGLVGLTVNPGARERLVQLYKDTLAAVERLPEEAEYRKAVEKTTRHRLQIVRDERDTEAIERKIDCGQIEELVTQAEDELSLIPKMEEWKPWEALAHPPPTSQW